MSTGGRAVVAIEALFYYIGYHDNYDRGTMGSKGSTMGMLLINRRAELTLSGKFHANTDSLSYNMILGKYKFSHSWIQWGFPTIPIKGYCRGNAQCSTPT